MKPYNRDFRSRRNFGQTPHNRNSSNRNEYIRPRETGREVLVENDNIEKAIRRLKKKVDREGILREIRDRSAYKKPSEKSKLAKQAAKDRWWKYVRMRDKLI